ncbi:ABC transporter substrate-binding protein [Cohnella sp. REN36]|uniref:ABC transporter substrate-binding protein n=1 Tax=Cohnella sp. REN36 TaxID=2887347 RepID=UPI001D148B4E|nr:ABC transporter substrate-binding protein [Cohnella sp. REN36]MCC3374468.1 ABC transporter substrate-binding protein [Cohnella sp. REN36]
MNKHFGKFGWGTGAILALSLALSACGGSNGSNASAGTAGAAGSSASKPVELTMAYMNFGTTTDLQAVQDEISKITKEKINATVKLMPIDVAAWQQQVNLLLAGNENLDLLVTSSFYNYSSQVAKNQLIPLDDLLAQYGTGIKDTMNEKIYNGTKIDGKIYGVPSVRDTAADYGMLMRKDLVDKYGIDLNSLQSFEDLGSVFQTIKDKEPGIIPLVQNTTSQTVASIMYNKDIDLLGDGLGAMLINKNDLKVVNMFDTREYKDAIAQARKWYETGYIMQDAATTQESGNSLVKAGKAFGYLSNMKPGFEQQDSKADGREMVAARFTQPVTQSTSANGFMLSIPRNSRNPERAMQLMNLLYTDKDIVNLLDNGIEGKHYVKNADGTIKMPDGAAQGYLFNQWEVGNNALAGVWEGTPADIWEQMKKFNDSAIFSKALGFTFDASPVKTEVAAATNVLNQYKVGLESGTLDPALLTEFNGKMKAAGLDRIIAEKQKQLDAWAAANAQ